MLRLQPLSKERLAAVRLFARQVADALEATHPIDMGVVLSRLGGQLGAAPEGSDGSLFSLMKSPDGFFFYASPDLPENFRRYQTALFLGFIFIDKGYLIDPERWDALPEGALLTDTNLAQSASLVDAIAFTSAFLLPEAAFVPRLRELTRSGVVDIATLAREFRLAEGAIAQRAFDLNLIRRP